jgi:hypothetical protein
MSGKVKLILSSDPATEEIEAIKEFEPVELSGPVDSADISRLIGDVEYPIAGARSYRDALAETAIYSSAWSERERADALVLASQAIRPLFDELAGALSASYRERGNRLLWALMKASATIGEPAVPIEPEIETADIPKNRRMKALDDEERRAVLVGAICRVMKSEKMRPAKSTEYALLIRDNVAADVAQKKYPGKGTKAFRKWPSPSVIKKEVTRIIGPRPIK